MEMQESQPKHGGSELKFQYWTLCTAQSTDSAQYTQGMCSVEL